MTTLSTSLLFARLSCAAAALTASFPAAVFAQTIGGAASSRTDFDVTRPTVRSHQPARRNARNDVAPDG